MTHVGASLQTLNQRCEFNMKSYIPLHDGQLHTYTSPL